jgi:hypothetical protein
LLALPATAILPTGLRKTIFSKNGKQLAPFFGSTAYVGVFRCFLLASLIVCYEIAGSGKSIIWYVSPYGQFMAYLFDLPVQQLSKMSIAFAKLGQLPVLIFTVIFGILQSRMSGAFYLPSLSNFPVNPMVSQQSSLNSIYPMIVDPASPATMRLWNA